MKKYAILSILGLVLMCFPYLGNAQESQKENPDPTTKIEVIDFYGTHRCMTCKAIEANTKYTLDTYFSKEMKNGTIKFLTVNVDDEKNFEKAEKFEASGTALFLNVMNNGEETQIDLTELAFMKGKNKEEFSKALKIKIEGELIKQ